MVKKKWIQKATNPEKKGSLHKQLGIPLGQKIPKAILHDIEKTPIGKKSHGVKVTRLVKNRVVFAINVQKRRRK